MSFKQIKTLHYSITPKYAFVIALLVFVFDQITKYVIKANISPYQIIEVLPFFDIVYVENIGSAFGMFKSLGNFFFIVIAATAMVFVTVLMIKDKDNRLAFSLILGGAAGNLTDRIIHGYVIDFLDVHIGKHHWPAFNVADSALTIGISLLVVKMIFYKKISI
ncbi:MAG: signal peptidase II [Nitrospirae bacterium]|nr:signal peptidase II [Nitrospirota bacterium]